MTYSPNLGSTVSNTKMRTPNNISRFSGMCSVCTASCTGMCEIGLSALRGREATYPYQPDRNQFASEKDYPIDFSHLNINGRVFGAKGCKKDPYEATFPKANVETTIGKKHPIKLKMPIVLPAIAKLNWKDYFGGAALAGVLVVIGEDVVAKDDNVVIEDGKIIDSPLIKDMVEAFRLYYRGYGDIMLQGNFDDENLGVLDYAIQELGVESVELKFGQAAKGIQGMNIVKNLDKALAYKKMGYLIFPDPEDEEIAKLYKDGKGPHFEKIGKLPIWNENFLVNRVRELRNLGAKRVCFKTGPFDPNDLAMILKIASKAGVDMVTFDGAGGGSGNSPVKMMNEWGIPTIIMESLLYKILQSMEAKGYDLPKVAVAGGIAMEDQVYKALALGAPYISMVGIGRAAMTAAMVGKRIEELLSEGIVPKEFKMYGDTKAELFADIRKLKLYYENPETISGGAIGLYSYLDRIKAGIQQFMALNRKFALEHINRQDVVPLTVIAKKATDLKDYLELTEECLKIL